MLKPIKNLINILFDSNFSEDIMSSKNQTQKKKGGVLVIKKLDCRIVLSKLEFPSRFYVDFRTNTVGKGMNLLILPAMGLIVLLLFFWKDGFSIK